MVSLFFCAMHALVAATLGYGSTHKEPFDQLEDGGTLLWPGQSQQVLRNDASKSTVEVSAPADAAWGEHLVDAALRHVVKVAASWSPQNYFNACKTPVASRSPRALRPVYASSECEAVEPASASIRCQDETQPI